MANIYFDSSMSDEERRQKIFEGDIFVLSPTAASLELCALAEEILKEAFAPYDPETAQDHMPVEQFASILAEVKPQFIHHPGCKHLIPQVLDSAGCDLEKNYFDVPRLRTSTAKNYLTTGIAYAFHPHRDTWYSAAQCQINWWMPVRPVRSDNCMSFYPKYFSSPVKNGSSNYDYYRWNKENRKDAARHIGKDTRVQPKPEEDLELAPDLRLVTPVGALILFSAAQLHASVENTSLRTRLSIDFRVVNRDDVASMTGARNVDSSCTGTALRDFLRCTDLERLPEDLVRPYDHVEPTKDAITVYQPDS